MHITFVGRTEARFLAMEAGLAHQVLDLSSSRFTPLFSGSHAEGPEAGAGSDVGEFLASFDITVSLLNDPQADFADRLRSLGARSVLSFQSIRPGEPAARQLYNVLRPLGLGAFPAGMTIFSLPTAPRRELPARFAVLHVGSGSHEKNWPVQHFAALGREALAAGFDLLVSRGEADAEPVAQATALLGEDCQVVTTDLVDLAAIISRAAFFVGNDSGVTHLAGQLGAHTVAVFGPTDPAVWGPIGPRVHVVRGEGGTFPSLEAVRTGGGLAPFMTPQAPSSRA